MRSFSLQAVALLLASASMASASLNFKNYCNYPIYVKQSHNGGCNVGTDLKQCDNKSPPYVVNPNGGTFKLDLFNEMSIGTSVKIARVTDMGKVTQFEYTPTKDLMFWDLSDIDGAGPARTGSPFFTENVRVTPMGNGAGVGICKAITCKKNQACKEAYQFPEQTATKSCPMSVNTWAMDFCVPDAQFNKREVGFAA